MYSLLTQYKTLTQLQRSKRVTTAPSGPSATPQTASSTALEAKTEPSSSGKPAENPTDYGDRKGNISLPIQSSTPSHTDSKKPIFISAALFGVQPLLFHVPFFKSLTDTYHTVHTRFQFTFSLLLCYFFLQLHVTVHSASYYILFQVINMDG